MNEEEATAVSTSNGGSPVVWITGAGGGLGMALAAAFSARGWRVAAGYRSAVTEVESPERLGIQLDVTQRPQVQAAAEQILEKWGRIDALINNAGVTADNLCWRISDADWDRVMGVNLKGAFLCAQAVLRPMLRQRTGHIINISSFAARNGHRGQSNYAAAKAGLLGLTESLAREVGSRNVRVNAVLPGVLPTRMTAGLTEAQRNELASANVLGRINAVEEVAEFTEFLARMRNVSGQLFQLDSRIGRWT